MSPRQREPACHQDAALLLLLMAEQRRWCFVPHCCLKRVTGTRRLRKQPKNPLLWVGTCSASCTQSILSRGQHGGGTGTSLEPCSEVSPPERLSNTSVDANWGRILTAGPPPGMETYSIMAIGSTKNPMGEHWDKYLQGTPRLAGKCWLLQSATQQQQKKKKNQIILGTTCRAIKLDRKRGWWC